MQIDLRPYQSEDLPFLRALYGTTRDAELSLTNFSELEKEQFIQQQFNAQHQSYTLNYPNANLDLVLHNGQAIGRLYVDRRPGEIRIMDVALLPNWQNKGIGTKLMKNLQTEGRGTHRPLSLHVERNNPRAFDWYEKLGFRTTFTTETHLFMVWPEGANVPPPV